MQRFYRDLEQFVRTKYPHFRGKISGDVYPPAPYKVLIANLVGYIWMIGIVLAFAGSNIFKALGIEEPWFMRDIQANRMTVIMVLFVANNIAGGLLATGAFEVFFNDELVYSKLQSNRFPSANDLLQLLATHGWLPIDHVVPTSR